MNQRERFAAIMDYRPHDRMPVYFFGTWLETKQRWQKEGLAGLVIDANSGSGGPQLEEMDPDWEEGMWPAHGMVNAWPIAQGETRVLEECDAWRIVKTPLGAVIRETKQGASIPQHLEYALQPTRASWERFKGFIRPDSPARIAADWRSKAETLNGRDRVVTFMAGSLYGGPREWMGVEALSYLVYDDPALFEEILDYLADFYIQVFRPILKVARFDFAYFFEDCCFNTGPLFSPEIYRKYYHKYYRRLLDFYRGAGIRHILIDSDGKVDDLVPCWLESGFDILFPVEIGTWNASPLAFRRKYGRQLRMLGGVNKHVIPKGEAAIREHLAPLRTLADEGGYIPIPDHRIPPDCSLNDFRTYLRVFKEIFGP